MSNFFASPFSSPSASILPPHPFGVNKSNEFNNLAKMKVGKSCLESFPCQHDVELEFKDGSIQKKTLTSPAINSIIQELGKDNVDLSGWQFHFKTNW
jgi:hypothetical protein